MNAERMPPLGPADLSDQQKQVMAEFADLRGYALRGPFVALLRSPQLLARTRALGDYLRFQSPLPGQLRELVILLVARRWSQSYEWSVHCPLAVEQGLAAATTEAIAESRRPTGLTDDQQGVYDFCVQLLDRGEVDDATFAQVRSHLDEAAVVDIIGLVGYYTFLAMILNVARPPLPADATRL